MTTWAGNNSERSHTPGTGSATLNSRDARADCAALAASALRHSARASREFSVALPVPGVWLRSELFPAHVVTQSDAGAEDVKPEAGRTERRKRG